MNKVISKSQEKGLKLMPHTNMTFIDGSANFMSSILLDHIATDEHKQARKEKNHEDAISTCSSRHFFLTAIWLSHGQLWAIFEGTASLT